MHSNEFAKYRLILLIVLSLVMLSGCGNGPSGSTTFAPDVSEAQTLQAPDSDTNESQTETTDHSPATEINEIATPEVPTLGAAIEQSNSAELSSTEKELDLFCDGGILHSDSVAIPKLAKPPYKKFYVDPAFGSSVIRITNSQEGEVNKPAYSTMQAWNADESLLLLYNTGSVPGRHILLNGHTYAFISELNISPVDIEEVFWSHTDPDILFYVSSRGADYGEFKSYSVKSSTSRKITDFKNHCGNNLPLAGNDVQMQSLDDDLFGFRCQNDSGHYIMLSYRPSTDEVTTALLGDGSPWSEWTAPVTAAGGTRFLQQGAVVSADLQTVERVLDMGQWQTHSNIGRTSSGQDALYATGYDPSPAGCDGDVWQGVGHLIEYNLETGACRPIISEAQGYPYPTSATHVSAQAYLQPERIVVSSIGREDQFTHFTNSIPAPALLSEVYLADTTPNNSKTCRLAHHRSYGKSAKNGGYTPYFGEPHATISPTGTRIVFGSDWYDSGSVDSYIIELPGYQRP